MKKKNATSNVLIRSDFNLLALGLLGVTVLFGSMFLLPNTLSSFSPAPQVAVEYTEPQNTDETFAAEPAYEMEYEPDPAMESLEVEPQDDFDYMLAY